MKQRKGIVLFVTLMLMLLLMTLVSVFLDKTKQSKDNVSTTFAIIQTNLLMHNLLEYIKTIKLDEEAIHFASLSPIPLSIGQTSLVLKLDSAQKYININSFVSASMKDNLVNDKFILLLTKYKIEDPYFFLDILKDTVDKDVQERNSQKSEIINQYPTFRNSRIYNKIHLEKIKDYYFEKTGDNKIYKVPFSEIFGFSSSSIDINFLSLEGMQILFEDANSNILKVIAEYPDIYAKIDDLPFDDYYLKKIKKGMLGQSIATQTSLLNIEITINYKAQFRSKINFEYNLKSKKVTNYTIQEITLEKL